MSNSLAGSNTYLQLFPSNHSSTGSISYRDGNPVINFVLGEQERFLIGSSVRLCGNIAIYKTSDGAGFGTVPVAADDLNVSPKLSTYGMLDQIVITSQKNKNVIEHVRHYGRYLASYLPAISSIQEAQGHLGVTANTLPDFNANKMQYVNNLNGANGAGAFRGNSFCINMPTGLLNSKQPIGLSGRGWGTGGLEFAVHLAPDSQFLNGSWTNAFYQLTNVCMICEVINPSVDELSRLMNQSSGTMEYNAISSYYTTLASSNAIINFRLGLSKVLGIFMNFIPSEYLNNLAYDSYGTLPLLNNATAGEIAPIKQIVFTKGGERLPLMYNLDTNARDNSTSQIADPQLFRNFMNCFVPYMKNIKTQISPITNIRYIENNGQQLYANAGQMFGVGVSFDNISGEGIDFRNENFGAQLETGLTEDVPHSAFLFVRSKQTLVFNANGLQVIQ